jgi:hypothetical protein
MEKQGSVRRLRKLSADLTDLEMPKLNGSEVIPGIAAERKRSRHRSLS